MNKLSDDIEKARKASRIKLQSPASTKDLAEGNSEFVRSTMSESKKRASELLANGKEIATVKTKAAKTAAHEAVEKSRSTIARNPFLTVAGAIAIGAVIGVLIPKTRTENKYMRGTGHNINLKTREIYENIRKSGEAHLENLGLNKDELTDQAKNFLGKLLATAKSTADAATSKARRDEQE